MTFIRKIQSLDGHAVFRDFTWPADLHAFSKYNLVYGPNGSGKTTVSRLLDTLSQKQDPSGRVAIELGSDDNRTIKNRDFSSTETSLRVFNADFIEHNVRAIAAGSVESIYIGSQNVQEQANLESLRSDLQKRVEQSPSLTERRDAADRAFERHCIDTARRIKEQLRSPGDATNPYNNFDRRHYEERATPLLDDPDVEQLILSDEEAITYLQLTRSAQLPSIPTPANDLTTITELQAVVRDALALVVLGQQIDDLVQDSELAEWLRHGLTLHSSRGSASCLYCERTPLPETRTEALRAHFSDAFENAVGQIDAAVTAVSDQRNHLNELMQRLPKTAEFYDDLRGDISHATIGFQAEVRLLDFALDRCLSALQAKRQNPFEHVQFDPDLSNNLQSRLATIHRSIEVHNSRSENLQADIDNARERIARSITAESVPLYKQLLRDRDVARVMLESNTQQIRAVRSDITAIEAEQRNFEEAAVRLQNNLRAYLGHGELEVRVEGAKYSFRRAGDLATRLSEGEKTAVALLYFLQTLHDERLPRDEVCVVLDDPVSSQDEGSLYAAVSFLKEELEGVAQIIILTHNDRLFGEIRKWFRNVEDPNRQERYVRYYSLETETTDAGRCARLSRIPSEFANRGSLYEYWFWRVKQHADGRGDLVDAHGLPNIARRLLEQFCAYNYPEFVRTARLGSCLDAAPTTEGFEDWRRERLKSFVNDESHGWRAQFGSAGISQQKESRNVAGDVLAFMEAVAPDHVEKMSDLVAKST